MKAVILVVFVLTVAAVLCLLEAYREQQYFKVTEDGVVSRRLNGLKKEGVRPDGDILLLSADPLRPEPEIIR